MKYHFLKRETIINEEIDKVFDFFSKAENLNLITPPELGFKIITELPVEMKLGAVIDYKIKLNGFPFKWKTVITKWEPPYIFEDSQTKGPYKTWIHEHLFEDSNGNTIMKDTVKYLSPGGILEFIPHNLIVKKKVESIFNYRENKLKDIFP
ncbi:MAG TPA: SRPBCC family protein [Ignavibacteria bacterium]|nr:SRPBCC family protein [Ignavibacteria bacterium]